MGVNTIETLTPITRININAHYTNHKLLVHYTNIGTPLPDKPLFFAPVHELTLQKLCRHLGFQQRERELRPWVQSAAIY